MGGGQRDRVARLMDANTRFLIDECLSPGLTQILKNEFGLYAIHVPWLGTPPRGHGSWKDQDIVARIASDDFVLVTNNRRDFVGKYYRSGGLDVHNGLVIILQKTDYAREAELFRLVMKFIASLVDTVNKLVEINANGEIRIANWPDHNLADPWVDPFRKP